jgi:hypothetical protein
MVAYYKANTQDFFLDLAYILHSDVAWDLGKGSPPFLHCKHQSCRIPVVDVRAQIIEIYFPMSGTNDLGYKNVGCMIGLWKVTY